MVAEVLPATDQQPLQPAAPRPRWGMGDVAIGLAITIGASAVVAAIYLVLTMWTDLMSPSFMRDDLPSTSDLVIPAEGVLLALAAGWVGAIGWPIIATRRKGTRSLRTDFGLTRPTRRDALVGVGVGAAALAVNLLVSAIGTALAPPGRSAGNTDSFPIAETVGPLKVVLIAAIVLGAPFAEELFYRGLTLRAITRRWGPAAGIAGSALLFGLVHFSTIDNPAAAFSAFTASWAAGLLFAFVAHRRGTITSGIISHALVNGTVVATIVL